MKKSSDYLSQNKKNFYPYLIILFVSFLGFGNTIFNGYNLDDELVSQNHPLTDPNQNSNFIKVLTEPYHTVGNISYGYRPVSLASFFLEHKFLGEDPMTSHIINLILYALTAILCYWSLRLYFPGKNSYLLLFISLLFVLHPIHTEVAASIKNREEILSLLFFLCGAISFSYWIKSNNWSNLLMIAVFVLLSLLSKKSALPLFMLLPLFFLINRQLTKVKLIAISIFFFVPLCSVLFSFHPIPTLLASGSLSALFVGLIYATNYWKSEQLSISNFHIITGIVTLFICGLAILLNQSVLFAIGLISSIFLWKNGELFFILTTAASLTGALVFEDSIYAIFSVINLSYVLSQEAKPLESHKLISLLLLSLLCLSWVKGSWLFAIVYLAPVLIFLSSKIKSYIPFLISLFAFIFGFAFFSINIFQLGLLLGSTLILLKSKSYSIPSSGVLGSWLLISFGLLIYQQWGNTNFEAAKSTLKENLKSENQLVREGREIKYMENTLVAEHTLNERLGTGFFVLGKYASLLIFPNELSFYYGYNKIYTTSILSKEAIISIALHLLLLIIAVLYRRRSPLITIGICIWLTSILLFSNWPFLVAGMVGERLAFAASLGFCMFIGGLFELVLSLIKQKTPIFILAGLILTLSAFKTFERNELWESRKTLMSHDIQHLQESSYANYLCGVHTIKSSLNESGNQINEEAIKKGISYFNNAIEIYPDHFDYHYESGNAFVTLEELEKAKQAYLKSYELRPDASKALLAIVKCSFGLKDYEDVLKYGEAFLEIEAPMPIVYEFMAYSAYFNQEESLSREIAINGLKIFPNNENLTSLLSRL